MTVISTPITELLGIKHPVLLAGMYMASSPGLASAVTNAGGLGVIGGYGFACSGAFLRRREIQNLRNDLDDKNAPFGVDLLLPKVGDGARKTNYDYTMGRLPELIDIIIQEKTKLFIAAIGVPPKAVVDKLHKAGILVMNMVGHPKHVAKALHVGADIICAQAGEGGGHTGDMPASVLIPACVDAVKGRTSPLTGKPVYVVGAGAVYDGRGLAANLMWGAQAVWVGTRFVASVEAGVSNKHKRAIVEAGFDDVIKTVIYTGRPVRVKRTPYIEDWETNRKDEIEALTSKGIIPHDAEMEKHPEKSATTGIFNILMGNVAVLIDEVLPAQVIVEAMVQDAVERLQQVSSMISVKAKL